MEACTLYVTPLEYQVNILNTKYGRLIVYGERDKQLYIKKHKINEKALEYRNDGQAHRIKATITNERLSLQPANKYV